MKKNKALTAAISVLSLTMVSMCAIGGTFAKYTTNNSGTDTAKVAKWGVTVEATTYNEAYEVGATANQDEQILASGVASNVLIAPGANGKLVKIDVEGQPEVAVNIDYDATVTFDGLWEKDDSHTFYFPVVFKVNDTPVTGAFNSTNDVKTALEAAIEKIGKTDGNLTEIEENTVLGSTYDVVVSWEWEFSSSTDADKWDSYLASQNEMPSFSITVSATVTQVN